jgi:coenzyme F420-0:L-glutamate ligase / coenzyme F420-1:gamma-L-glutamate ligase
LYKEKTQKYDDFKLYSLKVSPLTLSLKKTKFDLFSSLNQSGFKFRENDVLVISSKYVSVSEGSVIKLDKVKVSKIARFLSSKYHIHAKMAELTLRESDYIFGGIPGLLLAAKDGILAPNAGLDKSNVPRGSIVMYPRDPFKTAENLRRRFLLNLGIKIGVIISDSRLMPTRIGTTGVAIACAGIEPIEDQRGKKDLFGNILRVTFKAVADSLATIGVAVMGESNESRPAAVIRNLSLVHTNRKLSWQDMAIDAANDIYIRGIKL